MKATPFVLAIRAISAEFAQRVYVPVVIIGAVIIVIAIALLTWAVTVSAWWWLLFVPVIFFSLLFALGAVVAWFALRLLRPKQNSAQRSNVRSFVDSIQQASETIATPKVVILFRLVKDMVFPSEKSYVRELSANATSLKSGLQTIVASFK